MAEPPPEPPSGGGVDSGGAETGPAADPPGHVRAHASVPLVNRAAPSAALPPFAAPPRVYGKPITQQDVDSPLPVRTPRQRQAGQSVYSDLLNSPDEAPGGQAESSPATAPAPSVATTGPGTAAMAHASEHYAPDPSAPAPAGPPPSPAAPQPPPTEAPDAHVPQQREATEPTTGPPAPSGGPATDGAPPSSEPGRSGPPTGVIVGLVLITAALLVLVALSIPLLLQHLRSEPAPPYTLGDCVAQRDGEAQQVDCAEPGAFQVVHESSSIEECPQYPRQNAIRVDALNLVYCLDPVGEDTVDGDGVGATDPNDADESADQGTD